MMINGMILDTIEGNEMITLHIASWDYIKFECINYDGIRAQNTLISSGYFNDGMFAVEAIKEMHKGLKDSLLKLTSEVCDIRNDMEVLHRQLELITDHEEYEVK